MSSPRVWPFVLQSSHICITALAVQYRLHHLTHHRLLSMLDLNWSSICCLVVFVSILMALSLTVFAERDISLIFGTISRLFLKSENRSSDILINDFFMYSQYVNGFPRLTISWAATKLAAVVEFIDLAHFLKVHLLCSAFCSTSEMALFRWSPA